MNYLTKIENKDGINVVSSRVIANQLGKQHKHVLESIDNIIQNSTADISALFLGGQYVASNGKRNKEYLLTKDGFTLYMFNIQGFNDFKMAYINEFNRMEKEIKNKLPNNYIEALECLLIDNYGWNISTETGYNTTFPETVKFGSVVMKLKKSYCFDMNNHLKEILNKEN